MAKSARFRITAPALPGCEFASREALVGSVHDALAVQALLDDLNRTGDADAFAIDMAGRGFEWDEIDAMARTRVRLAERYVAP
jgi:hypothetical protein